MRNAQEIYTTGELSFHLSRIKGLSSILKGQSTIQHLTIMEMD